MSEQDNGQKVAARGVQPQAQSEQHYMQGGVERRMQPQRLENPQHQRDALPVSDEALAGTALDPSEQPESDQDHMPGADTTAHPTE